MFDRRQQVMFQSNKKFSLFPGILQVERSKIGAQASLARANHCYEAKVFKLFGFIDGSFLALHDYCHIQLQETICSTYTSRFKVDSNSNFITCFTTSSMTSFAVVFCEHFSFNDVPEASPVW